MEVWYSFCTKCWAEIFKEQKPTGPLVMQCETCKKFTLQWPEDWHSSKESGGLHEI